MRRFVLLTLTAWGLRACSFSEAAEPDEPKQERNVDGIMDNSFLVEEAYNQEPGVVQHIFNAVYSVDQLSGGGARSWNLSFTQEWPVPNQKHQFSYTIPYGLVEMGGHSDNGVGDVFLNYRFQAYYDEKTLTGFAPRFSLILPTGEADKGFGDSTLGYQWLLPFSTTIGDRWFVHANAGLTYLPHAGVTPGRDLLNYNLGASVIYCAGRRINFMLEWIGLWNESANNSGGLQRDFVAVISPGVRYAFNFPNESQLVCGLGVPVGLTRATPGLGVLLYFSFEHFFKKQRRGDG